LAESNPLLYVADLKEELIANDLYISTFTMDELDVEPGRCGLAGSPTKVHKVESVVLTGGEHDRIEATKEGMSQLVEKLLADHILG
jgi:electron transfer flavoprotein beta subunit